LSANADVRIKENEMAIDRNDPLHERDVTLSGVWPAAIAEPERETAETLIERGKAEIRAHVAAGIVPATVTSFSDLHDYVDANCYAGLCDDALYDLLRDSDVPSEVQDALHYWIVSGGLVSADEQSAADAAALAAPQAPRVERLNWIGMPTLEVDIDVILMGGRALVTRGARVSDADPTLLDIYGDEWRTPLREWAPRQFGDARLVVKEYPRGYYPLEATEGFEYYRVRRAPLPVVILERRDSGSPVASADGWGEWMVDDPLHWYAMRERVEQLQSGRVLIAGLGLGIMLRHIDALRPDITDVTVVELDADVIELVGPTLPWDLDGRLRIVRDDFYAYIERLHERPSEWPDAILWDLAVGDREQTRLDFIRAEALCGRWLPGVPLHRFGTRGPDRLGHC
jgi:hypothetical protein